jgi:uncharacterized membrane protein YeaQ/YmgE (transglycosylase-associated protein family)
LSGRRWRWGGCDKVRSFFGFGGDFVQAVSKELKKLSIMFFLWYLLIGLVAGWLANLIVKGRGSGLIVNLVVGIVGGVLGGWIFSLFGLFAVGTIGSIVTSVVGAIVLLWIVAAVGNKKEKKID